MREPDSDSVVAVSKPDLDGVAVYDHDTVLINCLINFEYSDEDFGKEICVELLWAYIPARASSTMKALAEREIVNSFLQHIFYHPATE